MTQPPIVVPVSDLRRDTARLIERAGRNHEPIFITQRGYVTAVLLSRSEYEQMCVLRDKGIRAISGRMGGSESLLEQATSVPLPGYWDE